MNMKRIITILIVGLSLTAASVQPAGAQIPIVSLITGAIKKVIKAIDLKIQQQQNKVIWLQNAQKALENAMSKTHLKDIAGWEQKQQQLYAGYFDELRKVKDVLTTYTEVRDMVRRQQELLAEYHSTWSLLRQDRHFSAGELQQMSSVYSGIIDESLRNVEQMELAVTSLRTSMSDGQRMLLLRSAAKGLDKNVSDLRAFNDRNIQLSLSRAQDDREAEELKQLYGLP